MSKRLSNLIDDKARKDLESAIAEHHAGRLQQAEVLYRNVLARFPDCSDANHLLGVIAYQVGHHAAAVTLIEKAIALNPDVADYHGNLGLVLMAQNRVPQAVASYQRALEINPESAEVRNNLGSAQHHMGELELAIECYQTALKYRPNYAEANNNLGNAYYVQARFDLAIAAFNKALAINPQMYEAYNNLGNAQLQLRKLDEAIVSYDRALTINPKFATAYNNRGNALKEKNDYLAAGLSYEKAVELNPKYAEAMNNLGNIRKDTGRLREALDLYRRSITVNPFHAATESNLVYSVQFHPDFDAAAILSAARHWNQQHVKPLEANLRPHNNDREANRRLRIGYVSPDFRDHVVGRNLLPLIRNHDKEKFEIFCYAQWGQSDAFTEMFKSAADHWRDIVGVNHNRAAEMIREDKIDILVDLALHMSSNRLLIFARKPAPIQVTFGGYPGTTGMDLIDYRLTDPYLDPHGETDPFYSEQSVRLPDSFWCYDTAAMEVPTGPVSPLPAKTNGFITFGCLNNFCKVNDKVLELWAQIIRQTPGSRLILLVPPGPARQQMEAKLKEEGIEQSRLEWADRIPRKLYLELYNRIDLGLDTFPYNGHTTSLDSLWMGVPVVTLVGQTVVGRAGWSQLCNLDLKELAANTPEQFVAIAVDWANDLARLEQLRGGLRQRMQNSPLCDAKRFTHGIESAYRQMWHKWCSTSEAAR